MKHGVDAIRKYNTRTVDFEVKEDGEVVGKIQMARLPVEEMVGYLNMFESIDSDNPNAMFNKKTLMKLIGYMETSILSAQPDANREDVKEFIVTHFMRLFEKFAEVNGGGMDIKEGTVPDNVRKQLDDV